MMRRLLALSLKLNSGIWSVALRRQKEDGYWLNTSVVCVVGSAVFMNNTWCCVCVLMLRAFFSLLILKLCAYMCETEQIWIHSPRPFSPHSSLKPQSLFFFFTLTGQINPAAQLSISRRSLSQRRPANSRSHGRLAQRPESELLLSIPRKSLCPFSLLSSSPLSAGQSHPSLLSSILNPLNLSLKHPAGQDQRPAKHLHEVHTYT